MNENNGYVYEGQIKGRLSPVSAILFPRLTFWKVKIDDPATLDIPSSSSVIHKGEKGVWKMEQGAVTKIW